MKWKGHGNEEAMIKLEAPMENTNFHLMYQINALTIRDIAVHFIFRHDSAIRREYI